MFRSPNDASSSDSESDSNSDEEIEVSRISTNKSASEDATPSTPSQHASLITASLLEFHYTVRAVELLNAAAGPRGHVGHPNTTNRAAGNVRYDRQSPEAIALAKKMFANGSQLLASHGMLTGDLHTDELKDARQRYLTGIDSLGVEALRDTGALPPTPRLALEIAGASNFTPDTVDQHGNFFMTNINQIAIPSLQRLPGLGRYETEFTEVKQLGKGGFGTVYHVVNFVDKQHYAIKKIILDPRRLNKRWQEGGQEEVESVLREIRTLASLEHSNIVRYFGAWIEKPQGSPHGFAELEGSRPPIFRRLLGDKLVEKAQIEAESVSGGSGIVFGEDSAAGQPVEGATEVEATTSTISLSNDTDIFTDGDGQGGRSGPESADQITLCLQMALHQLNLASYLSPQPSTVPSPDPLHNSVQTRHCFHLKPSLSIFLGILAGVQYLHSAAIVHRDLKPANIFLSEDSILRPGFVDASCLACPQQHSRYLNARIGDFGLVGNIAEDLSASASASEKVVGTELYRPPRAQIPTPGPLHEDNKGKGLAEQVNTGTRIDEKIDVFALGVLLFELLWRFDTKTERFVVLNALTRSGTLPAGFGDMLDGPGKISGGEEDSRDGPRQQTRTEADRIAECIAGMVHSDPGERWDCNRVKECVDRVLQMC
jgi:translation initiation factor 2-alpha kinase 3